MISMIKLSFAAIITLVISCTSSDKKSVTEDTKNKNEVGVQNVNGNIPDTTNAINLSTHKKDTATRSKDSVR